MRWILETTGGKRKILRLTKGDWISVKERLPEPAPYVLAFAEGWVRVAECERWSLPDGSEARSWTDPWSGDSILDVTHWMELPAPPEKE